MPHSNNIWSLAPPVPKILLFYQLVGGMCNTKFRKFGDIPQMLISVQEISDWRNSLYSTKLTFSIRGSFGGPPKIFGVLGTLTYPKNLCFFASLRKNFRKFGVLGPIIFSKNSSKFPKKNLNFFKIEQNYHFYIQISAISQYWSKVFPIFP